MDCSAPPTRVPVAPRQPGNSTKAIGGSPREGGTMTSLKGKTLFVSGGSRGIGLAIALRAARDGANAALAAKTGGPHPKLKGTIYTAADEIRAAGGKALPIPCAIP